MKTYLFLFLASLGLILPSCNVDSDNSTFPVFTRYRIVKDSSYITPDTANNTVVRVFDYNRYGKVVKVQYKKGGSTHYDQYDTLYYNDRWQVSKVETYNRPLVTTSGDFLKAANSPVKIHVYNYTGGYLSSVNESGFEVSDTYRRTRYFAYTDNRLSALTLVTTSGSGTSIGPDNLTDIVFYRGNITSAEFTDHGKVKVTYDLYANNPYFGLDFKSDDLINLFCQNNLLKAYLDTVPNVYFQNNSYTYLDGRVISIISTGNGGFGGFVGSVAHPRTTNITYEGF